MRVLVDHTNQEMSGVFIRRFSAGLPFRKRWDDKRFVPPAVVPSTRVGYLSIMLLPELSFVAKAYQGKHGAGNNRYVSTADDFQQPQSVSYFLVAPLVSANHSRAQHLTLRRLT